jgi:hypothetical protein
VSSSWASATVLYLPDQEFLLPQSLCEWLPENQPAYFVSNVVDNLNLSGWMRRMATNTARTKSNTISQIRIALMKGSDGLVRGYNSQAAVEPGLHLIVEQSVTPAANNKQQLEPMVQVIEQQSGQRPAGILADGGIARRRTWSIWRLAVSRDTTRSRPIPQPASSSMTNTG